MKQAYMVARGIDTLVLNGHYTDDAGMPVKQDLEEGLQAQLRHEKEGAIAESGEIPTSWMFAGQCLHMQPNGGNHGQFPYLLKCPWLTLAVSHGKWNGIAQVRLSSEYLWKCAGIQNALVEVHSFLNEFFGIDIFMQVSHVDLCVDIAGWSDVLGLNLRRDFVSRSRKRATHDESDWSLTTAAGYSYGLVPSGFDFSARGPMSCTIYDKTRELKKSGKVWMEDVWRANGWDEEEDPLVVRFEFKFTREAIRDLKHGDEFHGIESAYDLKDRLEVLWAYAAGQVDGGGDVEMPDGWLRCVVPDEDDSNRSRWPTHPNWVVVQKAFTVPCEVPAHFGKIIRKAKEKRNIDKAIESMFGYATSLSAWEGDNLTELDSDISTFLVRFVERTIDYQKRSKKDFATEVRRKRVKLGLQAA